MAVTARRGRAAAAAIGVGALASLALSAPQVWAGDVIPGDNGTVKIDGVPFDDAPNNEPHPGCNFQVDFYGYDQGNFDATVKFYAIPPTGKNILLLTDKVFVGEDPAGGGTDLDGSGTYNLSDELKSFMAHPQQGYHIKLVVNAPYSQGDDRKHKAFWVQECAYAG